MAHYDIYIINGQSNANGVLSVSNAPVGVFTAGVLNGVKVWNGSAVVDLNVTNVGPSGNGHTWVGVGSSSNGNYCWPHLVLSDMATKGQNPLAIIVTEGGSCLSLKTLANGSHNVDVAELAASFPTTPILHTDLVDRYNDCIAFLDGNLDTYTIRGVLWDQGEADADTLIDRVADLTAKFAAFRSLTGEANLPIYYCTRPRSGTLHRPYMDEVDLEVAALSANNHCMKLWNGSTFDGAHFDAETMIAIKDWVVNEIDGTNTEQTVNLAVPSVTGTEYNALAKAIELISITDENEAAAVEHYITEMQSANLWTNRAAVFLMVGNDYTLNLKNPTFRPLIFTGASKVATGVNFDGVNDQVNTSFKVQSIPEMRISNFTIACYLKNNSFATGNQTLWSWNQLLSGAQGVMARMFVQFSNRVRIDIADAGFALNGTDLLTDNQGMYHGGVYNGSARIYRNGASQGTKAYAANGFVNSNLIIGVDIPGGSTRWLQNVMPYFSYGLGMTDAEVATHYGIVQDTLTLMGRQA